MPGHAGAAARSYPEYFDKEGGAFNPANPKTYDFVRGVLTEVARLFPAPYLDFAADEVGDETWKGMADVDRLKAEQGLKTTKDVQAYLRARSSESLKVSANGRWHGMSRPKPEPPRP